MQALELTLCLALSVLLSYKILSWDIQRITPVQRARSWNSASVGSALLLCQHLCLFVHFVRTRRSWSGAGLGLLTTAAVQLALVAVSALLALLE